jgi:hypothetical protein
MIRILSGTAAAAVALGLFASFTAAQQGDDEQQAYVSTTSRGSTRVAYFGKKGSAGELVIDYGQPPWKEEYQKALESKKLVGQRWRLGQDFWTNLDSSMDFRLGNTMIKAGYYYLTLELKKDGSYVLGFHDPAAIRKIKLDAFLSSQYKQPAVYEVTLEYEKASDVAKQLVFNLQMSDADLNQGVFSLQFGPHKLKAPLQMQSDHP